MKTLTDKIKEIKQRAAPINYSSISVNEMGVLEDRESLLDQRIVEGYGCIWGVPNQHNEIFHRGAFAKSIKENGPGSGANYEIKFRDEHGRSCALFQILEERELGLYFRTKPLDDVSWCDDMLVQLRSKTVNNFSDGFNYIFDKGAMSLSEDGQFINIFQARLMEISGVSIPSDMQTFAIRSVEEMDELYDLTEDFIKSLPRKNQLEARHIFARHKTLLNVEPLEQRKKALETEEPSTTGIDYNYLSQNLKF